MDFKENQIEQIEQPINIQREANPEAYMETDLVEVQRQRTELEMFLNENTTVKQKGDKGYNSKWHSNEKAISNRYKVKALLEKDKENQGLKLDEESRQKLISKYERSTSQLLLNSKRHYAFWDSAEMKAVKTTVKSVENAISAQRKHPYAAVSGEEVYPLILAYDNAIAACQKYVEKKTTKTGTFRFKLVKSELDVLMKERDVYISYFSRVTHTEQNGKKGIGLNAGTLADILVYYPLAKDQFVLSKEDQKKQKENQRKECEVKTVPQFDQDDKLANVLINLLSGHNDENLLINMAKTESETLLKFYELIENMPSGGYFESLHTAIFNTPMVGEDVARKYEVKKGKFKTANTMINIGQTQLGELFFSVNGSSNIDLPGKEVLLANIRNLIMSQESNLKNNNGVSIGKKISNRLMRFVKNADYSKNDAPPMFKENAIALIRTRFPKIDRNLIDSLTNEKIRIVVNKVISNINITSETVEEELELANGITTKLKYESEAIKYDDILKDDAKMNELRKAAIKYIAEKTRIREKEFEIIETKELHEKAVSLSKREISINQFIAGLSKGDKIYKETNTKSARYLNDESTIKVMELLKKSKEEQAKKKEKLDKNALNINELKEKTLDIDEKVKFVNKKAMKKLQAQKLLSDNRIEIKNSKKMQRITDDPDWTDEERTVKEFLSQLLFTEKTWESDLALKKKEAEGAGKNLDIQDIRAELEKQRVREILLKPEFAQLCVKFLKNPALLKETLRKIPFLADKVAKKITVEKNNAEIEKTVFVPEAPKDLVDSILSAIKKIAGFNENQTSFNETDEELLKLFTGKLNNEKSEDITGAIATLNLAFSNVSKNKLKQIQDTLKEQIDRVLHSDETKEPQIPENKANKRAANRYVREMLKYNTIAGDTGDALFVRQVLKDYFVNISDMDQRSVMAYMIREADPSTLHERFADIYKKESDIEKVDKLITLQEAKCLTGMIKGAGPLLQKILQGLPEEQMPLLLKDAVKETKSNLLPIPDEIVKAQLNELIDSSNAALKAKGDKNLITSINVDKSLGAASIGQAFLITVFREKDKEGTPQVIKILRPDVKNRMEREVQVVSKLANQAGEAVSTTYLNTYTRINEELNFGNEADNIKEGVRRYNKENETDDDKVKAMNIGRILEPTEGVLILDKAPGITVNDQIQMHLDEMQNILGNAYDIKARHKGGLVSQKISAYGISKNAAVSMVKELEKKLPDIKKKYEYLVTAVNKWLKEALYSKDSKGGYFHGDLHAGNIMMDDNGATIIDFGNASFLNANEQNALRQILAATAAGQNTMKPLQQAFSKLEEATGKKIDAETMSQFLGKATQIAEMGDGQTVAERMALMFTEATKLNIPLPSSVANFVQGQLRLQNTVNSFAGLIYSANEAMHDIREAIRTGSYNKDNLNFGEMLSNSLSVVDEEERPSIIERNMQYAISFTFETYATSKVKRSEISLFSTNDEIRKKAIEDYHLNEFKKYIPDEYKEYESFILRLKDEKQQADVKEDEHINILTHISEKLYQVVTKSMTDADSSMPGIRFINPGKALFFDKTYDEEKALKKLEVHFSDAPKDLQEIIGKEIETYYNSDKDAKVKDNEVMKNISPYIEKIHLHLLNSMKNAKVSEKVQFAKYIEVKNYTRVMAEFVAQNAWATATSVDIAGQWAKDNVSQLLDNLGLSAEEVKEFIEKKSDLPSMIKWLMKFQS